MPSTAVTRTFLCNVLVCAAVWLAYAGRSVTDKMVAVILPVSAFIAAGFEHCVANMYFLPLAWLLVQTGHAPANFDASLVTMAGIIHNVVPVTLGNIVGGAGFVGAAYWAICRVTFGESASCSAVHGFVCLRRKAATGEQARNIAASWQAQHNRSAPVDRLYDALAFAVLPSSSPNSPATCFRRFATSPDNSALADSTS